MDLFHSFGTKFALALKSSLSSLVALAKIKNSVWSSELANKMQLR